MTFPIDNPKSSNDLADTTFGYAFTVFTPTYNRAGTLERLFDSICRQTFRNFEWLVVDDGSTDGTSTLFERFSAQADFPIRYLWQPNAGKHAAFNRGVREAKGALFLTIDSDDELTPDALEILHKAWLEIPESNRTQFTGVTARCVDRDGRLVGEERFPSPFDSDSAEATLVLHMRGERIGFHRTDILRSHPFPPIPTRFIPEGRVWLDIARRYRTRFIEAPARIFHDHDAPRLSALDRSQRAWGDIEYYRFALAHYAHWWRRAPRAIGKLAVGLRRAELHLGTLARRDDFSPTAKLVAATAWPVAAAAYARDLCAHRDAPGVRLLIARLLLGGRGGPRIAALLGGLRRRLDSPAIAVHAAGVVAVFDPSDPQNDELLFSPRTFKAELVSVLRRLAIEGKNAVVVGRNVTFIALQLARSIVPGSRIFAIESDARQSERTRASARASCTDNLEAIASPANPDLLTACDLLIFDDVRTAQEWLSAMAEKSGPTYLVVEISKDHEARLSPLKDQLRDAGYGLDPASTPKINVWVRLGETPKPPNNG